MAFYLSPPTGNIPYQKLEDYALKRLRFQLRLVCCSNPEEIQETLQDASVVHQSDCLISGSSKDVISHHMLRLALCEDSDTRAFVCSSELALFRLRLAEMGSGEWNSFFKKTEKELSQLLKIGSPSTDSFLSDLELLIGILKQDFGSWCLASKEICNESQHSLHLPFQLVLGLVARREVSLFKGLASVPLSKLSDVLCEMFQRNMDLAIHQARAQRHLTRQDPRIRRLAAVLKRAYRQETRASHPMQSCLPELELSSLWSQAECFPPCMFNLMDALKQRHRLAHHDRIQLTLFLKELGLSLHEALLLWKQEYSKPPVLPLDPKKGGWHGNERRYIYSIRHLYGLEGGRVNYRGHSCQSVQGRLSSMGCGNCPFSSLEESQLSRTCDQLRLSDEQSQHVIQLVRQKQFGMACATYMKVRLKTRQSHTVCAKSGKSTFTDNSNLGCANVGSSTNPDSEDQTVPEKLKRFSTPDTDKSISLCATNMLCSSQSHQKSLHDRNDNKASYPVEGKTICSKNPQKNPQIYDSSKCDFVSLQSKRNFRRIFKIRSDKQRNCEWHVIKKPRQSNKDGSVINGEVLLQVETESDKTVDNVSKMVSGSHIDCTDIVITRPSDYYRSYLTLLDSLQSSVQ